MKANYLGSQVPIGQAITVWNMIVGPNAKPLMLGLISQEQRVNGQSGKSTGLSARTEQQQ